HGFATSADSTWRSNGWIDLLGDAGRTVLAPDLLGHGKAPKPHDPEAYDELEDRVLAALPDGPVDAIAFSLRARALLGLASAPPERFGGRVLAGVGANLFRPDESSLLASALEGEQPPENPAARYFAQLAQAPDQDPQALAAYTRRPKRVELRDEAL